MTSSALSNRRQKTLWSRNDSTLPAVLSSSRVSNFPESILLVLKCSKSAPDGLGKYLLFSMSLQNSGVTSLSFPSVKRYTICAAGKFACAIEYPKAEFPPHPDHRT